MDEIQDLATILQEEITVHCCTGFVWCPYPNVIQLPDREFSDDEVQQIASSLRRLSQLEVVVWHEDLVYQSNRKLLEEKLPDSVFFGSPVNYSMVNKIHLKP